MSEPLWCGSEIVGFVLLDGGDYPWYFAAFRPGPAFAAYAPLFERVRFSLAGEWDVDLDALEAVNALGLRLEAGAAGRPGYLVDDFQFAGEGRVEFKLRRLGT